MQNGNRYLKRFIREDLKEKMVFLSGPRQVGKTTLALSYLGGDESYPSYFNWDYDEDRNKLLHFEFPPDEKLIVLDEIHKYKRWRNWLKGLYDKTRSRRSYLVTGSARLDYYKRGGDALTGRYHSYRLHPFTLPEIDSHAKSSSVEALFNFGGFPEPFLGQSERKLRRWQRERMSQILRDDLRDLERVEEVTLIGRLVERLPALVGSPLSINSLREDLQVAHQTVRKWIEILERLYIVFRIPSYGSSKIRAVKKEQKLYFWDWSSIPDPGARFENMTACHLLKYCHFLEDTEGYAMDLRYLRDTDKREVDFVVTKELKPLWAVECKKDPGSPSPSLAYFAERLSVPCFYQVHMGDKDFEHPSLPIRVIPFERWTRELGLV